MVIKCTQENKSGAPSCPQEKGTGALLTSRERNWCSTVFRRRDLVLYCSQENETGALMFSRKRKLVHYCYQEKETGNVLFLGERIWCSTVLRRKKLVHYCSQEEGKSL